MPCSTVHCGRAAIAAGLAPRSARSRSACRRGQRHQRWCRSSGSPQLQRPGPLFHFLAVCSGTASPAMTPSRAACRSGVRCNLPTCPRIQLHWIACSPNLSLGLAAATLAMSQRHWARCNQASRTWASASSGCSSTSRPDLQQRRSPTTPARRRALRSAATGLHRSAELQSQPSWGKEKCPSLTRRLTVRAAARSTATTGSALTGMPPLQSSTL